MRPLVASDRDGEPPKRPPAAPAPPAPEYRNSGTSTATLHWQINDLIRQLAWQRVWYMTQTTASNDP